jgi:RecB family exonuclease
MNKLHHISASQLSAFESCPRKWFGIWICKCSQPPESEAIKLGKAVHKILEILLKAYLKNKEKYKDPELLTNLYAKIYELTDEDKRLAIDLVKNGIKNGWTQNYTDKTLLEDDFKFNLNDDIKLIGRFDRIDFDKNKVTVIDLKTGKKKYTKEELTSNWQAKLYALSFLEQGHKNIEVDFWFLRHKVMKQMLYFKQDQVKRIKDELNTTIEKMINCDGSEKKTQFLCAYCPFKEQCSQMK